ncbi:hypothetical protein [Anabaena sp. CCY 9910]|uniref:hypothetical protein n=1 Tax=Anabaena sp. CCY 9910 TaxID=3103870 RepID=UPI0039E1BCFD
MKDYWREKAKDTIAQVIANFAAKSYDMKNLTDSQKRELRMRIDAAYPFNLRKHHPFTVWQEERRIAFDRYALNQSSTPTAEQPSLF